MKKLLLAIITLLFLTGSNDLWSQDEVCGRIGLIGEHTGWTSDVFMTRDPENPDKWSLIVTLKDNTDNPNDTVEVKFRQNADWAVNWGDAAFPSGTATQNGPNIPVPAGTYVVAFDCSTGAYSFTSTCGDIGLIGEHTGWTSDVFMTRDANNPDKWSGIVALKDNTGTPNDTVEVKFRQNADWAVNWGGAGFPSGTGTQDGPNIKAPEGTYAIEFNCSTGDYSFTATCGSIGLIGEHTGWTSDVNMVRDPSNPDLWSVIVNLEDMGGEPNDTVEVKFRQNADWAVNWGGAGFPSGTGTQDGPNIKVPQGTYKITFNCSTGEYTFTATCGEVSMIGEFINWNGDIPMTRDAQNPDVWTLSRSFAEPFDVNPLDGIIESKFRQNRDWTVNWGAAAFPSGTATSNGANIRVVPGKYDITFNCATGEYSFVTNDDICGEIGLVGGFNNFGTSEDPNNALPTDVLMVRDPEFPSQYSLEYNFTSTTTLLFRQDGDPTFFEVWGGTAFPTGVGVKDPSQILNVPGGKYAISFNCKSGDYDFVRLGNSVIAPKVFTMNVDGNLNETDWNLDQTISRIADGEAGDDPNTVTFGVTHNDEYLFIGVEVKDGNVVTSGDPGVIDGVQIFIDGNKNGGDYDASDAHFIVHGAGAPFVGQGPDGFAPEGVFRTTADGYIVEAAVKWADLGVTPEAGQQIGFDIAIDDNDGGEGRQSQSVWNGNTDNASSTSGFGDLLFGQLACGNISMFSEAIGDVTLRSLTDPATTYVATYEFESNQSVVFRKDNQGVVTWGASAFPSGTATIGGDPIAVPAGRYRVRFDCIAGSYTFTDEPRSDAVALAQFTSSPVTIDGNLSEFTLPYGMNVGQVDGTGTVNNEVEWGALWDGFNLYIAAQVTDATVQGTSTQNPWEQDAIELYIDGNHDSDGTYDGNFDTQLICSNRMTEAGQVMWAKADGAPVTDFDAVFVPNSTGYTVEIRLAWSNFNFTAGNGRSIGFSIGNNDSDGAIGTRDYQTMWAGGANNWNTTATHGDLQLAGGPLVKVEEPLYNASLAVFPNPTSGLVVINTIDEVFDGETTIMVSNIVGQTILVNQTTFHGINSQYELDIANLPNGAYFINIFGQNGKRAIKKLIKQ